MPVAYLRLVRPWLAAALVGLAAAQPAAAQGEATSIPLSRDLVTLGVRVGPSAQGRVSALNGGMATVTLPDGTKYGLVPVIKGQGVTLSVALITKAGKLPTSERLTLLGQLPLERGVETRLPWSGLPIDVRWVDTTPGGPEPPPQEGPCNQCCLVCDGVTYCGCRVDVSCGSCCCRDCGGCGLRPPGEPAPAA
jgi:hypothetical protein